MSSFDLSTLTNHWARVRVSVMPPATQEEIATFERRHSVRLPDEIRAFYLAVNGFAAANDQDQNGFSFWPLARISPVATFDNGHWSSNETKDCFLFADYLSLSWGYAFCLAHEQSPVCIVGTHDARPIWIARNFSEFLDLYLRDDQRLYPPGGDRA